MWWLRCTGDGSCTRTSIRPNRRGRTRPGSRRPILIDFDLASTSAEERPGFTHQRDIIGTLPHIAPEQSGRTGWPVDQRTDLYGLGATLYELATGSPPFGYGDDPLQLTHDLLTRTPAPAAEVNPTVPVAFSAIVAHLLEKEPDRRYQSAEGVLHDLRRLRRPRLRCGRHVRDRQA